MDGMPKIDPATGKVWCWSIEKQRYEWHDFSEVVEDHMNFDEGVEADIESTTDEERRGMEAFYGFPYRFLDDHDHLFRLYALGNYLHDLSPRPATHPKALELQRLLCHEFMVGEFKDVPLDRVIYAFKCMVEKAPLLVDWLNGENYLSN